MLLICGLFILTVLTETMGMSIIMAAAKCDLELTDTRNGLISSVSFIGNLNNELFVCYANRYCY